MRREREGERNSLYTGPEKMREVEENSICEEEKERKGGKRSEK